MSVVDQHGVLSQDALISEKENYLEHEAIELGQGIYGPGIHHQRPLPDYLTVKPLFHDNLRSFILWSVAAESW